jgi:solute carrier family 13 (sodium-dependent dicarboxylate transporter), member 2/3/5
VTVETVGRGHPQGLRAMVGTPASVGLWLGPLLAGASLLLPLGPDLAQEGRLALALVILMATWWITEALPLPVTALLPILAVPLMGIEVAAVDAGPLICATAGACEARLPVEAGGVRLLSLADLGAQYSNPVVLMYIGGFLLGIAIERCGLSTRIAYGVVARGGGNPKLMVGGFLLAAAFLSMWISNTSTTMILVPLAVAVATSVAGPAANPRFGAALVLAVAWAATIGGLATPIGTPTNGIALNQLRAQGTEVSFGEWMAVGLPVVLALLPVAWFILSRGLKLDAGEARNAQAKVASELARLGPLSTAEKRTAAVFMLIALLWVLSSPIADAIGPALLGGSLSAGHVDTMIATLAALLLFAIPAGDGRRSLLNWDDAKALPWGILLLFGGGLTLAWTAELSGLSLWLAGSLEGLKDVHPAIKIFAVTLLVIVITEFASNIATIALMGPVLISLALANPSLGLTAFVVPAAMAASMGFAMPMGTAPNAIAYGTGLVQQSVMIRRGLMLNFAALILLTVVGLTLAPIVFGR